MVSKTEIQSSNARLPSQLTAVFVGGTSGVGLYTLQSLARHCKNPKAYFIGRSRSAAAEVLSSLKSVNPSGEYIFIESDVSLIKNVDKVCAEIQEKEGHINILCQSQGALVTGIETEEGLHLPMSLILQSRMRFIVNLLPLLRAAPTLRRVVNVFGGTLEGPITNKDLQMRNASIILATGQPPSMVTLCLEHIARTAPDVSFVHDSPGIVRSGIMRYGGVINTAMKTILFILGPLVYIPNEESGDRHLFLATSARFPSKENGVNGVALEGGVVAAGSDGASGSGVYVVNEKCESGTDKVLGILAALRKEGEEDVVWKHVQDEFVRITGKGSL